MAAAAPPVAKKVPRQLVEHGDVRVDNYYWLRDDSRSDPDVLAHLRAENDYTAAVMSDVKQLEDEIYAEIRGRIKEDDIDAPLRKGQYYYYERTLTGKEYVQHCRRLVPTDAPVRVHDVMPTGPDAPDEHIIMDENVRAEGHDYYSIGTFKASPNNKLVVYAEDTKGDEIYTVYVIDAESGEYVGQPLKGITSDIEWAGDDHLVYVTMDSILRPDKVWLHKLGSDQSSDACLYHEKDDTFSLGLQASESKRYLFVESGSKNTSFIFYLDISKQNKELAVLTPRVYGIDTTASHRGNHFFIKRRSDEFYNSELVACPLDNVAETTILLPHRESVKIQDFQLFDNHIAVYERANGLPKVTVYRLPAIGESIGQLQGGQAIDFIDPTYAVDPEESPFNSSVLRFHYSSMRTPPSVYDYDMDSGVSVLKKIHTVLGGFDGSNYVTERKWAAAADGTQIPMSILYRKDLVKLDGSDPMLLYGYGSYEICVDPSFRGSRFSLVDRGFIYVIAHIRGGGEMGRKWYEDGKLLKKKNTFTDFIDCAEHLIKNKYCSKEKLCINGRSAGGLLMGAVLNMRPDLFRAAVAGVPFVDVVTTMLDPTIPLTTAEWEEWGDPRKEEYYYYMKSYSPVDNVTAQEYPNILVTAGLNDPRVMYSEPAKYVAKLRELKRDDNLLLFKCELGAGHFSKSGRFEKLQEDAFTYAFILKALGMTRKLASL
ncbi:hypothetical protein BDA96_10G356900 [Sorghum bicolor]|uniref:Prolyl endopeptidase n=2 Tax=Sorghum bicolor TaxID=4558 RepID=A0A921Q695_SORBI|nr:uncharacterized protein LOC8069244 [Sorghum bicolor]EER90445.1 hypothetical protein SORBI_3010G278300 [Sorghum bicolor]KAG0516379.1 hypothetical protein BDA96_10G356900 [Sorghum bicolor]|eukprot:XP_002439078.1 uncharacterized protein LOC8069244 [Sorghum bicolor]